MRTSNAEPESRMPQPHNLVYFIGRPLHDFVSFDLPDSVSCHAAKNQSEGSLICRHNER